VKEYEIEPQPGLPEPLPAGEHLLWQGAPTFRGLLFHAMPIRTVTTYFALLAAWRMADDVSGGASALSSLPHAALIFAIGAVPVALIVVYAWLTAHTTVYTITNRRVVMRFGLALPVVLNLPFSKIASAALGIHSDQTGDIPLVPVTGPAAGARLSFLMVWPHAKPWAVSRPEPMLRALPDPESVARVLAEALAGAADQAPVALRTAAPTPTPRLVPSFTSAVAT